MSREPGTGCSGRWSARFCAFRRNRSREWRGRSSAGTHEADENILQRAFARLQVLDGDAVLAQFPQQRRDAGTLSLRIERVDNFIAVAAQLEACIGQLRGN